jgi:hypothetical protein
MNLYPKDYEKLYLLQDKFLSWWQTLNFPFYLTGGTALGRFYLAHRYSEDLDFFCNASPDYLLHISNLKDKISRKFNLNLQQSLFTEDFTRFFITEEDLFLKVEFVNDVEYYPGKPTIFYFGWIDTPLNILSNKLTAIVGRDEPKDIFDIYHLALNYSFSWPEIFYHSKQKSVINEIDIAQRFHSFPVEWLEQVNWGYASIDLHSFERDIRKIAEDFLLGKENSLGSNKISIEIAQPRL